MLFLERVKRDLRRKNQGPIPTIGGGEKASENRTGNAAGRHKTHYRSG
nr:MAG TPA: hypothetical protein [Caudoviricetes sp.]